MNTRSKILIGAGALALLLVCGGAAWIWRPVAEPELRDPTSQTPEQVSKYMASEEFGSLSVDRRREYMEKLRQTRRSQGEEEGREGRRRMFSRGDLSEQERRQLRKNIMPVMEARMDERVDKYHELSTEDERKAYLDEMIDWMQTRMAQRPRRPESGRTDAQAGQGEDGQLPRGHPRFSPEGMKERIETTDPVKKARFAEFLKAMRKRMEERGIAFPHGGRGGRGR